MVWKILLKRRNIMRLFLLLTTAYMSYISLYTFSRIESASNENESLEENKNRNANFLNEKTNNNNQYDKLCNWNVYSQIKSNGLNKIEFFMFHMFFF
jgi:hypothetical protein